MAVRELAPCHDPAAEFFLFSGKAARLALPPVVQVVAEVVRVVPLVCLAVAAQEYSADVRTFRHKGLQDKGVGDGAEGGMGKYLFYKSL